MAVAITNAASVATVANAGTVTTAAFTPANSSLLIAYFTFGQSGTNDTISITDSLGTLTWTKQKDVQTGDNFHRSTIWTAPVTTGASMTVTAHDTTGSVEMCLSVSYATGHNVASPIGASGSGILNTTASTFTVTLSGAPASTSICFGGCCCDIGGGTPAMALTSGYTLGFHQTGPANVDGITQYISFTSTSFVFTGINAGVGDYAGVVLEIKVAAAGTPVYVAPSFDSNQLPTRYFPASNGLPTSEQQFSMFQPRGNVPVAGKPGWSSFFDRGPPPPTASRQLVRAFVPRGTIVSTTPQGWARFVDSGPAPMSAARQKWDAFQPQGTITSVTPVQYGGVADFFDSNLLTGNEFPSATSFSSSRQQWLAFQPRGTIVSTTPQGAPEQFFDSIRITLDVLGEASFPPQPIVPVPYGLAQGFDQNDSSWIPPISPAKHPFAAFQPRGTITVTSTTPQGSSAFFDSNYYASFDFPSSTQYSSAAQQWSAFIPLGIIVSITPEGWSDFFDSNAYAGYEFPSSTQFPSASQQWNAFIPRGAITSITPQGWWGFFDGGPAPGTAARQRFDAFEPIGAITSTTPQGWTSFYDGGRAPPSAATQQFDSRRLSVQAAAVVTGTWGWASFFDASRVRIAVNGEPTLPPPLGTLAFLATGFDANDMSWVRPRDQGRQIFSSLGIKPSGPVVTPPWGWSDFVDSSHSPNLPASQQQWAAFAPRGVVVSITPQGWTSYYDSGKAPASAARMPFDGAWFIPPPPVLYGIAQGFDQNDVSWIPPTNMAKHPFSAMAPFQPPPPTPATGPLGWARYFDSGPRPPTAALQQWAAYSIRFVVSITPQGFTNFFDAGPAPATSSRQPFAAFQPRGNVPPPPQPYGWSTFYDQGPAPATAARQPWAAFHPAGRLVSVTPQGWARFFDPGAAPPSAARQPWTGFDPRRVIPPPPLPNGWTTFYDPGRAPSTASRQPWSFFQPRGLIVSITPQGFSNFYDAGPPAPSAARQQWYAFQTPGFILPNASSIPWGYGQFFDWGPVPPTAALQRWDAWSPQTVPASPAPITLIGCMVNGRACDCGEPHRNMTFYPGGTWEIQGNLHYADGTPFNLSHGCQIMWVLADAAGNAAIMLTLGNGITVLDATQGTCLLLIPRAVSLTVPLGSYTDQLRAVDPTGYVSDQWTGPVTVAESFFT